MTLSPEIIEESWGRIVVEEFGEFKDVKLWPGGARPWDWNESNTSHTRLDPFDAEELIEHGAEILLLTTGRLGRLRVPKKVRSTLEKRGVEVVVLGTGEALKRYAELRKSKPVGALIHSTC